MRPSLDKAPKVSAPPGRGLWIGLIAISGVGLSLVFACATPFAALSTLAALKLGRRDAITIVGLVWAANQAIGFAVLGYPLTWDSAAWGLAIGVSAGLAFLTAMGLSAPRPTSLAVSLPFIGAFAVFELGLYAAGFVLPGSEAAFAASVVWRIFRVNALALVGLMVAYHLANLAGSLLRQDSPTYRAAGV